MANIFQNPRIPKYLRLFLWISTLLQAGLIAWDMLWGALAHYPPSYDTLDFWLGIIGDGATSKTFWFYILSLLAALVWESMAPTAQPEIQPTQSRVPGFLRKRLGPADLAVVLWLGMALVAHYGKSRKWFPFQPHYVDLTLGVCLAFWLGQKAFLAYKPALKPDQLEKAGDGLAKLVGIAQILTSQKSGTGKVMQVLTQTLEPEPPPTPATPEASQSHKPVSVEKSSPRVLVTPKDPPRGGSAKPKQSIWRGGSTSQAGAWTDKIVDYVRTKGEARRCEIAEALGIHPQTLFRYLKKLVKEGKLEKSGEGVATVYRVKKED